MRFVAITWHRHRLSFMLTVYLSVFTIFTSFINYWFPQFVCVCVCLCSMAAGIWPKHHSETTIFSTFPHIYFHRLWLVLPFFRLREFYSHCNFDTIIMTLLRWPIHIYVYLNSRTFLLHIIYPQTLYRMDTTNNFVFFLLWKKKKNHWRGGKKALHYIIFRSSFKSNPVVYRSSRFMYMYIFEHATYEHGSHQQHNDPDKCTWCGGLYSNKFEFTNIHLGEKKIEKIVMNLNLCEPTYSQSTNASIHSHRRLKT